MAKNLKRHMVHLDPKVVEKVDEIADRRGTSRARIIRLAIDQYVKRNT